MRYWKSPDWVRTILADRAETTATTDGSFAYSNAGSHLLAAILVEATGRSVLDYARAALFGPLGIPSTPAFEPSVGDYDADPDGTLREYYESDFAWPVDPQGVHEGAALLRLRPVDLAAIGLLHLQNGQWDGEQVVPADWVAASTTRQADVATSAEDYGYQWWVPDVDDDAAYLARGYGGQLIAVVPERDLVVVVGGGVRSPRPVAQQHDARRRRCGRGLPHLDRTALRELAGSAGNDPEPRIRFGLHASLRYPRRPASCGYGRMPTNHLGLLRYRSSIRPHRTHCR